MFSMHRLYLCLAGGLLIFGAAGCATNQFSDKDIHQFSPAPMVKVGAQQLPPMSTRPVHELLREADEAFQAAEAAQARGDREAARKHYVEMIELVELAGLDPAMFSQVRQDFAAFAQREDQGLYERYFSRHGRVGDRRYSKSVLQVPMPLPQPVVAEIERIQQSHRRSFQIALDRSHRYMPYIRSELEKAGLPPQLAYVAMVESHFAPKIDSHAGAGGMWQFMPATANRFKLRRDSYVDERYNWESSTHAAIEYLTYLYEFFDGSWELAISAYNMGEGGMQQAIDANQGDRNFWRLIEEPPASHRIKEETKRFLPKVLAYWIVAANPERYGFTTTPQAPENAVQVAVTGNYALADIDRALDLPSGTLAALNPDLIRGVTPPTGGYNLRVPVERREQMASALQSLSTPRSDDIVLARATGGGSTATPGGGDTFTYRVKRGDTLSGIAQRHGVTLEEITRQNNLRSNRHLRAGQTLRIPGTERSPAATVQTARAETAPRPAPAQQSAQAEYTVRRGDTLYGIAQRQGVSVSDLQAWNSLGNRNRLTPGQKLVIAATGSGTAVAAASERENGSAQVHEVKAGEYPAKIAKIYGVPVDDLLSWNDLSRDDQILVGQQLLVHVTGAENINALAPRQVHKVAPGEFPGRIANQYGVKTGDLLAWNNLTATSTLQVGQELVIYGAAPAATASAGGSGSQNAGTREITHTVAQGEVLGRIAERYNVSTADLLKWNNLDSANRLRIGQDLVIKQPAGDGNQLAQAQARSGGGTVTHVVAKGNTAWDIARQYGVSVDDLYRWNNWSQNHVLRIGEQVTVNPR